MHSLRRRFPVHYRLLISVAFSLQDATANARSNYGDFTVKVGPKIVVRVVSAVLKFCASFSLEISTHFKNLVKLRINAENFHVRDSGRSLHAIVSSTLALRLDSQL